MNPIEFLFMLIGRYVNSPTGRQAKIMAEANAWYVGAEKKFGLFKNPETFEMEQRPKSPKPNKFMEKVHFFMFKYGEFWLVQLFLQYALAFGWRQFADYLYPTEGHDGQEMGGQEM